MRRLALVLLLVVAGCASRQGMYWYRADVTPERARVDLAACQYDAELALAAYNTPGTGYARSLGDAAAKGLIAGLDVAARKDRVISSCMPAKGYALRQRGQEDPAIDRTIVAPQAPKAAVTPTVASVNPYAAPVASAPIASPATVVRVASPAGIEMPQAGPSYGPTTSAIGEWTFGAERIAKQSCADQPVARLTGKGPGLETFSVTCTNGDVLNIRCDYGQCRALR